MYILTRLLQDWQYGRKPGSCKWISRMHPAGKCIHRLLTNLTLNWISAPGLRARTYFGSMALKRKLSNRKPFLIQQSVCAPAEHRPGAYGRQYLPDIRGEHCRFRRSGICDPPCQQYFYFDPANEEAMILKCKSFALLGTHSLAKSTFGNFARGTTTPTAK